MANTIMKEGRVINSKVGADGGACKTVNQLLKQISNVNNVWTDTVYYSLGDSITAGSYSTNTGEGVAVTDAEWAYGRQIANSTGCKFTNLAIPGGTIISSVVLQASRVGSDATLVTITGGANDYYRTGSELGTITDTGTSTIYGALKHIINTIATTAPLARIVLISPFIIKHGSASFSTKWSRQYKPKKFNYDELNLAFRAVADYCNVEYIDGTTQSPTNIYNIENVQKDGVHPTIPYYSTIAQWLQSKLF